MKSRRLRRAGDQWNPVQIQTMIDYLSNKKGGYVNGKYDPNIKASDYAGASLTLITPANTIIDPDLINYAIDHHVILMQRTIEQSTTDENVIRVASGMQVYNIGATSKGIGIPLPTSIIRRPGSDAILNPIQR